MDEPSADVVKRLKEQHADRALHQVDLKDPGDEETYYVVMTGPNADEYKKFTDDVFEAREKSKSDQERAEKMSFAAKNGVLRQVVWPARDEVKDLLFRHPGFTMSLAEKIHDHAGSSAEVRSKKL